MLRICVGIVTYNPNLELLKKNVDSIINQVENVYIVDNGSKNFRSIKKNLISQKIFFIENDSNLGIAVALNQLCKKTLENNYDYILTLDQDSICPPNLISQLIQYASDDVAVIAPDIVYKNNEHFTDNIATGIEQVDWVITSASLTNLKIWKKIGGFDERLFIDGVDRDFGIRATKNGYKILKCFDVKLLHELGKLECRKKFGRTIYVTHHSPIRKYYMARNAIYLDNKFNMRYSKIYIFKLIIKTLLYEDKKLKKMSSIIKGIRDGKRMIV